MKPFAIQSPCHESWDAMRRDQGARHCASCDKHVVELATMTEAQVHGLIVLTGGHFCARQTVRDGAVVLLPTVAPRGRFPLRMALGGAVVASALAACAPAHAAGPTPRPDPIELAGSDPHPQPTPAPVPVPAPPLERNEPMMGDVAYEPSVSDYAVRFKKGSAKLDVQALGSVANAATALQATPWIAHVRIEGLVAADEGSGKKATALAQGRADAVRAALIKRGIEASRLRAAVAGVARKSGISAAVDNELNRTVTFTVEAN